MNIATSLLTGVLISSAAAYLGTLMLGRRMALVAGPLGHLTLPGIALALMYGFDVTLGAFPFVILGIVLIWLFEVRTKLPVEALTAIVFATGVAAAFLFLPIEQAEAALVGDIAMVGTFDLVLTAVLSAIIFSIVTKNYRKLLLTSISEDLARVQGINSKKHNLIYLTMVAIVVALGVKLVGGLMTAALVAIPACSARNLSRNLLQDRLLAIGFGVGSCMLGIVLSQISGHPAGVLIILINAAIFVMTAVFKR
jgi:ABC-type Mn2+/Zn2+ transport system permease subunit